MDAALRDKLNGIAERYDELGAMLCDPEIVGDKPRFLRTSREHADLSPVALAVARWQTVEAELAGAIELMSDPDMRDLAASDVSRLRQECEGFEATLVKLLLPRDPNDSRNVVIEIRAGTGGDEAGLFAADLWRMYTRYAEKCGWKVEDVEFRDGGAGGFKEVSALIRGPQVYGRLKFERGVHRVQRVPTTEAQGRIHTSAATVAILPEAEEVNIEISPSDLRIETMRSSGSGGQHVNTTDSAVRITHIPTGMAVHVQQEKSQIKNREIGLARLRARLLDLEVQRRDAERAGARRDQVGSGDRSEKVRTYNFPQDRVTDHRVGYTRHDIEAFLAGDLDDVIATLRAHDEAERLAQARQ